MARPFNAVRLRRQREKAERKIQRRSIRDASNPFEFPDNEFQRLFRANKDMAYYLCEELAEELRPGNNNGLPVHIKVLTCMRFMAEGNYQRGTGQDHGVCIAQTTVSKYLCQFTRAVVKVLLPQWISFPGTEPLRRAIADGFKNKFGVDDVLGAIDCTHIVDVDCKIINVVARYPGRVHDQFIISNSSVREEMAQLYQRRVGDYFLLGDSGYGLEPWVMTPINRAVPGSAEERYTDWHCQARNTVERANGWLKGVPYELIDIEPEVLVPIGGPIAHPTRNYRADLAKRQRIVDTYFQ